MTSRQRMLAAIEHRELDYVPCSFMIFHNLARECSTNTELVERQLAMGLDACAPVGHLEHSLHPDAQLHAWFEQEDGQRYLCRRIDTPAGALTQRVRQWNGWPASEEAPLFDDYVVPRAQEVLVKPEHDLEKLPFVFGPPRDEHIEKLRESAAEAKRLAEKHALIQLGGWCPSRIGRAWSDEGVMVCDAMAWLSGFETVMILSLTRPAVIREYVHILHKWNMQQIEIYLDVTDADIIWRRGWYETTEFWTPQAYRDIVAPTVRDEAELVHQAGRKYGYIITSAFMPILGDILDAGIDVLVGLDPAGDKGANLAAVKEESVARKVALWGGVSGSLTVELGTPDETIAAVRYALEVLGKNSGFILSPVDNVREDTLNARRNTQVFIDAWKEHRSG